MRWWLWDMGPTTLTCLEIMTDLPLEAAMDNIYGSLKDENRDIDQHIAVLKAAMAREGVTEAVFQPSRLAQNNRQGRKTMQAYFRKRGVVVAFADEAGA